MLVKSGLLSIFKLLLVFAFALNVQAQDNIFETRVLIISDDSTSVFNPYSIGFSPDGGVQDNSDGTVTVNLDTALSDVFWRKYVNDTGLTGDKDGSFDIDTTGSGAFDTGVTDGTTVIQFGNYGWVGNISGADVDISAGTGDFTTTGTGRFDSGLTDSSPLLSVDIANRILYASNGSDAVFNWSNPGAANFNDSSVYTSNTGSFGNSYYAELGGSTFGGNTFAGIFRSNGDTQGVLLGGDTYAFIDLSGQSWIDNAGGGNFDNSVTSLNAYIGTMSIYGGTIIDSSGSISFGNENLTTEGQGTFGSVTDGVTLNDGSSALHIYGIASTEYGIVDTGIDFNYVTKPNAPVAVEIDTAGNVDAGLHYYYVTYETAFGETERSTADSITVVAGKQQVTVTISVSPDYRVTSRKIYRTKAGEANYKEYHLATVSNNTTTEYIDNISDATMEVSGRVYLYAQSNTTNSMILQDGVPALIIGATSTMMGAGAGISGNSVVIGSEAGANLELSGLGNTLIGLHAGRALETGTSNVAIGYDPMVNCGTSALNTIAIGQNSLQFTSGTVNTGLGHNAGRYTAGGNYNVFVGGYSGTGANGASNIGYNTCVGTYSGTALRTNGNKNALFGYSTGGNLTTGERNTMLGYYSRAYDVDTDYAVAVGNVTKVADYGVSIGNNAGLYETATYKLFIDSIDRSTEAEARAEALIYGFFDAVVENQFLTINAGTINTKGKIVLTQTDGNEYIDSGLDGWVNIGATIGIEMNAPVWALGDLDVAGSSTFGAGTDTTIISNAGRMTMTGDGRYWIGFEIDSAGFKEPPANSATLVNRGVSTAYEFTDGNQDHIHASMRITGRWDDTENMEVILVWDSPTTSEDCYWQIGYQIKAAGEDMTDTAVTDVPCLHESSGNANGLVHSTCVIPTAAFDAGDKVLGLKIYRLGDELTDTLGASAFLHKMIIRGVADNLGGVVS